MNDMDASGAALSLGGTQKSREALLGYIDSLVALYNAADFESLMSMVALTCREGITVQSCLEAPSSTYNRKSIGVLTSDNRTVPYISQEKTLSSIVLIWLLLYSAHPDGVLKIIDRRICYRKCSASTPNTVQEKESMTTQETNTDKTLFTTPTTFLEVMVTLSGSCTTQESLHEVFAQVTADQSNPHEPTLRRVCTPSNGLRSTQGPDSHTLQSGSGAGASAAEVDVLLTRLGAYLGKPSGGNVVPCQDQITGQDQVQGQRRRYLIEFRLQFDEHDLVTHWTTTVLAAEAEEAFHERIPFIK